MAGLIVGSIYQPSSRLRTLAPTAWEVWDAAIAKLNAIETAAFDSDTENMAIALGDVLDWHRPWQRWEQVFEPHYIGDRYQGQGCRSCNWSSTRPCPTVVAVARRLGIEDGA